MPQSAKKEALNAILCQFDRQKEARIGNFVRNMTKIKK
jgi:hypothetical protein